MHCRYYLFDFKIFFSVSGVIIRNSSDFNKLVKLKAADLHTEIIIREDVKKKEEKKPQPYTLV